MYTPKLMHRLAAELLGTFWLVLAGVGSAIFGAKFIATSVTDTAGTQLGIGFLGVAFAFGLSVTTMAYAVGHVSGAHFNPAVTIGLAVARRFEWRDVLPYLAAQLVGGLLAGAALAGLQKSRGVSLTGNMAANGYGAHSPGGFGMGGVIVAEIIVTAFFLYVILGATTDHAPSGFAPIAIGFALFLGHTILIPVSNASLNPARSTAVAFFNGDGAPDQLWAFWVAPIVGAAIAGATYAFFTGLDRAAVDVAGSTSSATAADTTRTADGGSRTAPFMDDETTAGSTTVASRTTTDPNPNVSGDSRLR